MIGLNARERFSTYQRFRLGLILLEIPTKAPIADNPLQLQGRDRDVISCGGLGRIRTLPPGTIVVVFSLFFGVLRMFSVCFWELFGVGLLLFCYWFA